MTELVGKSCWADIRCSLSWIGQSHSFQWLGSVLTTEAWGFDFFKKIFFLLKERIVHTIFFLPFWPCSHFLLSLWLADEKAKSEHTVPGNDLCFQSSSQWDHDFRVKFSFPLLWRHSILPSLFPKYQFLSGPLTLAQSKLHQLMALPDFTIFLLLPLLGAKSSQQEANRAWLSHMLSANELFKSCHCLVVSPLGTSIPLLWALASVGRLTQPPSLPEPHQSLQDGAFLKQCSWACWIEFYNKSHGPSQAPVWFLLICN